MQIIPKKEVQLSLNVARRYRCGMLYRCDVPSGDASDRVWFGIRLGSRFRISAPKECAQQRRRDARHDGIG